MIEEFDNFVDKRTEHLEVHTRKKDDDYLICLTHDSYIQGFSDALKLIHYLP